MVQKLMILVLAVAVVVREHVRVHVSPVAEVIVVVNKLL